MKSKFESTSSQLYLQTIRKYIQSGNTDDLRSFLQKNKRTIKNVINEVVDEKTGRNCLHEAIAQKDSLSLTLLLKAFPEEIDVCVPLYGTKGNPTALHLAMFSSSSSESDSLKEFILFNKDNEYFFTLFECFRKQRNFTEVIKARPILVELLFKLIKSRRSLSQIENFLNRLTQEEHEICASQINCIVNVENGRTCLHEAVIQNSPELVVALFKYFSETIDIHTPLFQKQGGSTALHFAVSSPVKVANREETVLAVMGRGSREERKEAGEDEYWLSPEWTENENGKEEEIEGENKDKVEVIAVKNPRHADPAILEILLQYGAVPNFTGEVVRKTLLTTAISELNWDVVKMLIEHGAGIGEDLSDLLKKSPFQFVAPFVFGMHIAKEPVTRETKNFENAIFDYGDLFSYEGKLGELKKKFSNNKSEKSELTESDIDLLLHQLRFLYMGHDDIQELSERGRRSFRELKHLVALYFISESKEEKASCRAEVITKLGELAEKESTIFNFVWLAPYKRLFILFEHAIAINPKRNIAFMQLQNVLFERAFLVVSRKGLSSSLQVTVPLRYTNKIQDTATILSKGLETEKKKLQSFQQDLQRYRRINMSPRKMKMICGGISLLGWVGSSVSSILGMREAFPPKVPDDIPRRIEVTQSRVGAYGSHKTISDTHSYTAITNISESSQTVSLSRSDSESTWTAMGRNPDYPRWNPVSAGFSSFGIVVGCLIAWIFLFLLISRIMTSPSLYANPSYLNEFPLLSRRKIKTLKENLNNWLEKNQELKGVDPLYTEISQLVRADDTATFTVKLGAVCQELSKIDNEMPEETAVDGIPNCYKAYQSLCIFKPVVVKNRGGVNVDDSIVIDMSGIENNDGLFDDDSSCEEGNVVEMGDVEKPLLR